MRERKQTCGRVPAVGARECDAVARGARVGSRGARVCTTAGRVCGRVSAVGARECDAAGRVRSRVGSRGARVTSDNTQHYTNAMRYTKKCAF